MVLVLSLVSLAFSQNVNEKSVADKINGNLYPTPDKQNSSSQNIQSIPQITFAKLTASSLNSIAIKWPESGYYYILDALLLEIETANPSTCTYSFNSGPATNMIDNETYHYQVLPGLVDNMASEDPYVIDFLCNDGTEITTASTYFKINTTDLDNYFFRSNLGEWIYNSSERSWHGNDNGLLDIYRCYYENKTDDSKRMWDEVVVLSFEDRTSLEATVKKDFIDYFGSKMSIQSIGNKNFYVYANSEERFIAWISGNYFIINWVFPYHNSTPVNFQFSNEILNPYLEKYPDDLRYGVCGDGKTNVLNLEGNKEECDKNYETVSCGSNIGECKEGKKTRKCNSNCTWQNFGTCNSTNPKTDICDGKDNDCDGKIDEDFSLLNQICYIGIGACKQGGKYICSLAGSNVTCNALAKTPQKENCNDKIDNDCDGKVDFSDTSECILLKINLPMEKTNYFSRSIPFDIYSDLTPNDIIYSYTDSNGKKITVKLCSKCNTYNKTRSFNDGIYNITIGIMNKSQILANKTLFFLVDSVSPKITKTLPSLGFTNGNFTIEFKEINPRSLIFYYNKYNQSINLNKDCILFKDTKICNLKISISNMNGKEINYSFNLTDVSGNEAGSKTIKLIVDTTLPIINNPNSFLKKDPKYSQNIKFNISINEANLDSINYIDSFDGTKAKWNTLCNKLNKNNECIAKKILKKGIHNLKIQVIDKAGNFIQKEIRVEI